MLFFIDFTLKRCYFYIEYRMMYNFRYFEQFIATITQAIPGKIK